MIELEKAFFDHGVPAFIVASARFKLDGARRYEAAVRAFARWMHTFVGELQLTRDAKTLAAFAGSLNVILPASAESLLADLGRPGAYAFVMHLALMLIEATTVLHEVSFRDELFKMSQRADLRIDVQRLSWSWNFSTSGYGRLGLQPVHILPPYVVVPPPEEDRSDPTVSAGMSMP